MLINKMTLRFLRALFAIALALTFAACDPPLDGPTTLQSDSADNAAVATASSPDLNSALKASPHPISGDVVFVGGWSKGNKSTATAEFFDPTTKKFTSTASLPASAAGSAAALLTSGPVRPAILIGGGFGGTSKFVRPTVSTTITGSVLGSLEIYDPATGTFAAAGASLLMPRAGATATVLGSGKVLIAGGITDSGGDPTDTAEVFDPATGMTTATSNNMSSKRAFHSATLLGNGTVLLAGGGTDSMGDLTDTADIYDQASNKFSATGSMFAARGGHAAVLLSTGPMAGDVMVVGGIEGDHTGLLPTHGVEVYDPTGKTFSVGTDMTDTRAFPSATVLASGKVLVVGGFANFGSTVSGGKLMTLFGSTLKSAEVFDPVGGTFTCINGMNGSGGLICSAAMAVARAGHTATLFTSGPLKDQVLVAGGIGATKPNTTSSELNEAELYNPSTGPNGALTKISNLKSARGFHSAVLLP